MTLAHLEGPNETVAVDRLDDSVALALAQDETTLVRFTIEVGELAFAMRHAPLNHLRRRDHRAFVDAPVAVAHRAMADHRTAHKAALPHVAIRHLQSAYALAHAFHPAAHVLGTVVKHLVPLAMVQARAPLTLVRRPVGAMVSAAPIIALSRVKAAHIACAAQVRLGALPNAPPVAPLTNVACRHVARCVAIVSSQ